MRKRKPKFKVGQVVVVHNPHPNDRHMKDRVGIITDTCLNDCFLVDVYGLINSLSASRLRPLTKRERGT